MVLSKKKKKQQTYYNYAFKDANDKIKNNLWIAAAIWQCYYKKCRHKNLMMTKVLYWQSNTLTKTIDIDDKNFTILSKVQQLNQIQLQ